MSGASHRLAASHLCDKDDPSRLSSKELNDGWGSPLGFVHSMGLKEYNSEDLDEALAISRAFKEQDMEEQR